MNSIGKYFILTTFGESHGPYVGGVIDGCPPGLKIDFRFIEEMLDRRRGQSEISTSRSETDQPQFISGLLDGVTTGTPLAFLFPNSDKRSGDYDRLKDIYRPSHADYTYEARYGIRDHRGGGRSSARETVVRVVAGAIAMQVLRQLGVEVVSYTTTIGEVALSGKYIYNVSSSDLKGTKVGCPISAMDEAMHEALISARHSGDSLGGIVVTIIRGVPAGWGNPIYDKLESRLASAIMSIGAAKGFEVGDGFDFAKMKGSEANDPFVMDQGRITTTHNHSGGIQGGISNGAPICFRTVFKPIASISKPQKTIDRAGNEVELQVEGRHDASVFPRVLPVVDAMTALTLLDLYFSLPPDPTIR